MSKYARVTTSGPFADEQQQGFPAAQATGAFIRCSPVGGSRLPPPLDLGPYLPTLPNLLCELAAYLGVFRRYEGIISRKSPALAICIGCQFVRRPQMAFEHPVFFAVLKAQAQADSAIETIMKAA